MNLPFFAHAILAEHGIGATSSPNAVRVAVVARLPRSSDRKQFNFLADKCGTHDELMELAARTLEAFKHRQTPLLPPPLGEDGSDSGSEKEAPGERITRYSAK